jgi:hypothetical protein
LCQTEKESIHLYGGGRVRLDGVVEEQYAGEERMVYGPEPEEQVPVTEAIAEEALQGVSPPMETVTEEILQQVDSRSGAVPEEA